MATLNCLPTYTQYTVLQEYVWEADPHSSSPRLMESKLSIRREEKKKRDDHDGMKDAARSTQTHSSNTASSG